MSIQRSWTIAWVLIRRCSRDPAQIALFLIVPIVAALVFGFADKRANDSLAIGVVQPQAPLARDLVVQLQHDNVLRVRQFHDAAALQRAVRRGDVQAGVELPADYDSTIGVRPTHLELIGNVSASTFIAARAALLFNVDREAHVVAAARQMQHAPGNDLVAALPAARASLASTPVAVEHLTARHLTNLAGLGRSVSGMLVFFVFAVAMAYALLLIGDRRRGVISRAITTHATGRDIIVGEIGGRWLISMAQGMTIVAVSFFLLGVRWGDAAAVAMIIALFSLVSASAAVVIGCLLNGSHDQAVWLTDGLMTVLGVLGGCFFSLALLPAWVRVAGHVAPHAWAVDAFTRLLSTSGGVGAIGWELLALAGFAIVSFVAAVRGLERAL